MKDTDAIRAKNLSRAQRQVDAWEKESAKNQLELAELKEKIDKAFDHGKFIAGHLADAKEYLQDLQEEPNL